MILAAGFGTRLFPLTIDRTKPAIPFLGKPLVGYVAEYIASFGIDEIVVNLHHQPQSVIDALGDGKDFGVNIAYTIEEPTILGTAVEFGQRPANTDERAFRSLLADLTENRYFRQRWESNKTVRRNCTMV